MKLTAKRTLLNLLCVVSFAAAAEGELVPNQEGSQDKGSESIAKYILNLGSYLGYDLNKEAPQDKGITQELIDKSSILLVQNYVFNTFLGAIPVDAMSTAMAQFIPNNSPGASIINNFANATFKLQNYSSPAAEGAATFSVTPLMDQQQFQQDPVSQAVLNILGTPDYSVCLNNDSTGIIPDCNFLFQARVTANVVGPVPDRDTFFKYDYNQQYISQLNSNSLMGPMLYSTDAPPSSTGSGSPSKQNPGLTAQNQVQQAANFIRYASGSVVPISLPKVQDYSKTYDTAFPVDAKPNDQPTLEQLKAQGLLSGYFANLRVFAAQSSVGLSNLYYLMSKRLPQNQSGSDSQILTSQAMSEFKMATWRLFNAGDTSTPNKQWIDRINDASTTTVQKEIATLLAEINYQMYLDRQIQERILLTNTIMLIQSTKAGQPSPNFSAQGHEEDAQ